MNRIKGYPHIYPITTMDAEFDCLAQILDTVRELDALTPTFNHVKGHQDERTPYKELSLLAQLNCDVDTYANRFLHNNPDISHPTVHQFPAGECILQLQSGTIIQDLKQECSQARTLPAYQSLVTKKCQWSDESIFGTVDWSAHSQALKGTTDIRQPLSSSSTRCNSLGIRCTSTTLNIHQPAHPATMRKKIWNISGSAKHHRTSPGEDNF